MVRSITLISGGPRTGKTTLGHRIASERGAAFVDDISRLSGDTRRLLRALVCEHELILADHNFSDAMECALAEVYPDVLIERISLPAC